MLETIQEVPEPEEIDMESLEREKWRMQRERVMKLKKIIGGSQLNLPGWYRRNKNRSDWET